ncbi:MAG: hypothetical protein AAB706_00305 [Patescibacteria group bacterium]
MPPVIEKILKSKFLVILGMLVFIIVCIYFLLSIFGTKPESILSVRETGKDTETQSKTLFGQRIFFQPLFNSNELSDDSSLADSLNVPTLPIPKPDLMELRKKEDTPSKSLLSFFEKISKAAEVAEESIGRQVSAPTNSSPGALSNNVNFATSTYEEVTLSLTKDEFQFLYPEVFLKTLVESQTLLKAYDPSFEPLPKIETDPQVRFIQEKIIIALLSANMINKVEAERFVTTVRYTLPQLQLIELNERRQANKSFLSKLALNILNIFSDSKNSQGVFVAGLAQRLEKAFLPEVEAGGGGGGAPCGECHPLPLCFRTGVGLPIPGIAIYRPFCQCTGCLFGQGCLDICGASAALYEPITGICGCGL